MCASRQDRIPYRQIRAVFNDETIRVYQAYNDEIADSAMAAGTFVSPPFQMERMTWIKPSFLWMMYRSGFSFKDKNQSRILAIDITRDGFEKALRNSSTSTAEGPKQPVRVQWDPERSLHMGALQHRSIQIGLGRQIVSEYLSDWIVAITDITPLARNIFALVQAGHDDDAAALLPIEREYPIEDADLRRVLAMDELP